MAADAMARGLPEDQAEHEAVSRFGQPALVARKLRSAQGAGRLNRAVSTAWLLAGMAGCGLGAAYLVAAWWHSWQTPACTVALAYGCYTTGMLVTRITSATTIAAAVPRCCSAAGSPSGTQHWHPSPWIRVAVAAMK